MIPCYCKLVAYLAVTVGNRAKFPENVKKIAQTQNRYITSPPSEVSPNVKSSTAPDVVRKHMAI